MGHRNFFKASKVFLIGINNTFCECTINFIGIDYLIGADFFYKLFFLQFSVIGTIYLYVAQLREVLFQFLIYLYMYYVKI